VRLYLNGAFYNGTALDSSALLVMGYERAQRAVVEMLSTEGRAGWEHDKVVDPSGLRFSVTGKYPTLIPVSFASKTGEAVVERVRCVIAEFSATYSDVAEVEVDEADIDFFDFGVGVLAIKLSVIPRATLCIGELRALAENLSTALVKPLNELVANAVEEFDNAVKRSLPVTQLHASSWLQDDGYLHQSGSGHTLGRSALARLLWLHRTFILGPQVSTTIEEHVEELLPSLCEHDQSQDLLFVPGLGSSALLMRTTVANSEHGLRGIGGLLTLMDLQWAYIAAAMEIDRTLFRRLNGFRASAGRASAVALERESRSVLELYDRVRLFRASISSIIIDLGGGARRSWDVMARVQSVPEILATIDDKLSALRDACDTLLKEASVKRQRRIALTVDLFAGFSVVASIVAVVAFFFATDVDASTLTRVTVLTLAVLLVLSALLGTRLAFLRERQRL